MIDKRIITEIFGIVERSMAQLIAFGSSAGRPGAQLRFTIGDLLAHYADYFQDKTFPNKLLACYTAATDAGITVVWMDNVLNQLFSETPKYLESVSVVQNSILMALSQDAFILAKTDFVSFDDVEVMLKRMKNWFDQARELAAGQKDNLSYNALIALGGSITRYLADTARPKPRLLTYKLAPMPALTMSQYIYHTGTRTDELIAENKVVHPMFMPTTIRGLSA